MERLLKAPFILLCARFTVTQNPPPNQTCPCAGSPAPLTSLSASQELCRTGLSVTADRANKEIPALSHKGNISFLGQLLLQGNAQVDSPLSPVGGVLLLEISQIHGTFIYFNSFSLQMSSGDRAGVLLSIHKPEVQDDTVQVLPFHRGIFTQKVLITQAETAQGSNTKWENHTRTTLKVIFSYPWYNLVEEYSLHFA